jgi:hypothetical protein
MEQKKPVQPNRAEPGKKERRDEELVIYMQGAYLKTNK